MERGINGPPRSPSTWSIAYGPPSRVEGRPARIVPRNNVRLGDGRGHRLAAMTVTLNMPDELVERLQAAATARGISAEELAIELLVEAATPKRRHLAFAGIGASRHGISHRIEELLPDGFGRD